MSEGKYGEMTFVYRRDDEPMVHGTLVAIVAPLHYLEQWDEELTLYKKYDRDVKVIERRLNGLLVEKHEIR